VERNLQFAGTDKAAGSHNKPVAFLQPAQELTSHVVVTGIDFTCNKSKKDTFSAVPQWRLELRK
jgi:hypothetical protein